MKSTTIQVQKTTSKIGIKRRRDENWIIRQTVVVYTEKDINVESRFFEMTMILLTTIT